MQKNKADNISKKTIFLKFFKKAYKIKATEIFFAFVRFIIEYCLLYLI